jgi:KDO2-lipid IV(A) lauroyltransferase
VTLETCQGLARVLAWLACDLSGVRQGVVQENLQHAFPELPERARRLLARRMWEHLFLMVCEIAHAPRKIHETNWRQYFAVPHKRQFVRFLLDPRPTVLISGHFGNFEITSYMAGLLGFSTYAIARRLDNPHLDRYVNRFRSANGQFILPKDGGSSRVDAVLRSGGTIALLGDQSAGPKGCWVEFLGRPASCHKAISLFTLVSGAPLIVSYGRRVGGPLCFEIGLTGIADPREDGEETRGVRPLTQWYNARLAEAIRMAPEQYWWIHRRWKGQPPRRAKKKATGIPDASAKHRGERSAA